MALVLPQRYSKVNKSNPFLWITIAFFAAASLRALQTPSYESEFSSIATLEEEDGGGRFSPEVAKVDGDDDAVSNEEKEDDTVEYVEEEEDGLAAADSENEEVEDALPCNDPLDAKELPERAAWFGGALTELLTSRCDVKSEDVQRMFQDDPAKFGRWVESLSPSDYGKLAASVAKAPYRVELVKFLNEAGLSYSMLRFEAPHHKTRIHIAVTAAPALIERVASIARTWGNEAELPANVLLRYYFGHDEKNATALAEKAGVVDASAIALMPGVNDVEYPNTNKGAAVFRHMRDLAERLEARRVNIDWFFDGDDDSHVNVPNLVKFVADKDPNVPQYIGSPCIGRRKDIGKLQLFAPYCNGGPGFLITQVTLRALAEDYPDFLIEDDRIKMATHEDVRVGMFLYRNFKIGCAKTREWEFMYKRTPVDGDFDVMKEAAAIATHHFKRPGLMEAHHGMIRKFDRKHLVDLKPRRYE